MASTDRVASVINKLDTSKFGKLLERVIAKLPLSPDSQPLDVFSFDEREKLVTVFELKSSSELASILEFAVKTFQTAGFEQSKLESLTEKLSKNAHLDEEHVDAFVRVWSAHGKAFIDRLKSKSITNHQLIDVNFVLNVDAASEARAQINQPTAFLQLVTENFGGKSEKLSLEFDHGQLVQMYDKLEDIQKQLDAMTG